MPKKLSLSIEVNSTINKHSAYYKLIVRPAVRHTHYFYHHHLHHSKAIEVEIEKNEENNIRHALVKKETRFLSQRERERGERERERVKGGNC